MLAYFALLACLLYSSTAQDDDWPRRHPGKAAMVLLAPVRADWFDRWAGSKIKNRGVEYSKVKQAPSIKFRQ